MPETEPKLGLIARLIAACARNPAPTLLLVAAAAGYGWYAMQRAPLDAIPDLSDVQVIIFTEWPGQSPDLVEDQLTYPISSALISAPHVKYVRGDSYFGLSFVNVIFDDGTDIYWARSRVLEYLNSVAAKLPRGVTPTLGPDATGVGWVFEYALVDESGRHDLQQLRSIQDWNLRYALESVHGVAEVASVGGFVKQYQVQLSPEKLLAYGITIEEVAKAVAAANAEVGGESIEVSGIEYMIRGRGYVKSVSDIAQAVVKLGQGGTPVRVKDVAVVSLGPAMRRGIAELDGKGETVGGIVIMRYGENALEVISQIKARLAEVKRSLPAGVTLVATYDRSGLILASIDTLKRTLIEEGIVVSLVILFFLLHAQSSLVVILTLPIAVLLAFIPMLHQRLTANIMSLGGIAIAIGVMVDASIILIENTHKRLEAWEHAGRPGSRLDAIIQGMQEVGPSIFLSLLVITVSFLPVFTLEGTEGRLFRPLAFTKTYSMAASALLAVTLTPALAGLLLRGRITPEEKNPVNRWLGAAYGPVVRFVVRHRWAVLLTALILMVVTVPAYLRLESEFMPPLNEGVILYMPTAPPGMSSTEAVNLLQSMDRELKAFPEVDTVFGKIGRSTSPTDPAPIGMVETVVTLKPRSEWPKGLTWDGLIARMNEKLQYPGMPNVWWMPIQTRTEMLATGVRSPLGIEVFGDDLETIQRAAAAIEKAVAKIPGTRSAFAERSAGGFYFDIDVKREEAARHGLSAKDVMDVVESAIGGMDVTETVEGRERYPVNVRYARELRDRPDLLGEVLVGAAGDTQVPLSQVASIRSVRGPDMIHSQDGKLVGYVFVDTDRPIADYVAAAKAQIRQNVQLPTGIRLDWVGQFKYFERAKARLKRIIPVTLLLVFLLLYFNTRSLVETAIVLLAVPFSLVGAVWLLFLLHYHLSVAVWVGAIALAGLDAETGVVMLLYLNLAHERWRREGRLQTAADLEESIFEGAAKRIRPKHMTVFTLLLGLLPILWSQGAGADVMKRIAAPMVGGVVTSFLLELAVYPAIYAIWKGRELRRHSGAIERLRR
ncbi:MAG: efflux RND transporter permease subunit [Deltaproteobacteria bacterium]